MMKPLTYRPSLSFALFALLFSTLWLAGGASRADVPGQMIVRGVSWLTIVASILFARLSFQHLRPVAWLLAAIVALPLLQLTPLPPAVWQTLPGRSLLAEAAAASGQAQPWRPWAIVPGAAINAAGSLVVPVATLVLLAGLRQQERARLPALVLGMIGASLLVGLLQLSGAGFNNPFVNETPGQISGTFANRNHFALFLALGFLVAPVWAFSDADARKWRVPVALGLTLLFALTLVAGGSRAGLLLGVVALVIGLVLARQGIARSLAHLPRWVAPALIVGVVIVIGVFLLASVAAERAVSIDRVFSDDASQDMRGRALPTVLAMIRAYFPWGSGLGGFDPIFRIHEPFDLLKVTYFNHAHNDFLEIVLDAGVFGAALLLVAVAWWGWASLQAWSAGRSIRYAVPKLGSAMLLVIMMGSAFDYPARTPIIMALLVVAASWLGDRTASSGGSALPLTNQHL